VASRRGFIADQIPVMNGNGNGGRGVLPPIFIPPPNDRQAREQGKAVAEATKARGGTSTATGTRARAAAVQPQDVVSAGILKDLGKIGLGAVTGLVTGGPAGAVVGAGAAASALLAGQGSGSVSSLTGTCPSGFELRQGVCVQVERAPGIGGFFERLVPGGSTGMQMAGGTAVQGSFGLPAIEPRVLSTIKMRCPRGLVLGTDNLCYPKAILSRRSRWRKWKLPQRPPVTAAQARALNQIDSIRNSVKELGKKADLTVSSRTSSRRRRK
jgi:hypothetical protein